jgi:hypothetical protein
MNQIIAYLLFLVGKYLFGRGVETFKEYSEEEKRKQRVKQGLADLKEAVKKGDADEIRNKERDLLNSSLE